MTLPFAYKLSMRRLIAVNKNFEKEKREMLIKSCHFITHRL